VGKRHARRLSDGRVHGAAVFGALTWLLVVACQQSPGDVGVERVARPVIASHTFLGPATSVMAGPYHACGLLADDRVACWGDNLDGDLGNGTTNHSAEPVVVSGLTDAVALGSSWTAETCALRPNGRVSCWGRGDQGDLGNGTMNESTVPVDVANLSDAVSVSVGPSHVCALRATGEVACWGHGSVGELGDGLDTTTSLPVAVAGLDDAIAVASGGPSTSCAIRANGQIVCWGYGVGATPVLAATIPDARAIALGYLQRCVLRASGAVSCWGGGTSGELGDGAFSDSATPVDVSGLTDAVAIAAGYQHVCAVRATGNVVCWGANGFGQLGTGDLAPSGTPRAVAGVGDAVGVSTGIFHTCVARRTGAITCFGANAEGQLGVGDTLSSLVPVAVATPGPAALVAAGSRQTCAVLATGRVSCWGQNSSGELGDGDELASGVPVTVTGLTDAIGVDTGRSNSCALRATGEVACWGEGQFGVLGNGTFDDSAVPVAVSGLSDATNVDIGLNVYACARRASGGVVCWGDNNYGDFGDGTTTSSNVPEANTGVVDAVDVSTGWLHACATRATGEVACWGLDDGGQLGRGPSNSGQTLGVANVSNVVDAVHVVAGGTYACALRATREVSCWGNQFDGPWSTEVDTPTAIPGLDDIVALTVGDNHACALHATGEVSCWGAGGDGRLGDGLTAPSAVPVTVAGLEDAIAIGAGAFHTCAVRVGGQVVCWGLGLAGQLGTGTPTHPLSTTPLPVLNLSDNTGTPCASAAECSTSFCVDGVCCADACGGGSLGDCQACSTAAGGTRDGTCTPAVAGHTCRAAAAVCDVAEVCDGQQVTCPADQAAPAGTCSPVSAGSRQASLNDGQTGSNDITINFSNVTNGAVTLVETQPSGVPPPTGYQFVSNGTALRQWDFATTATYSGSIIVCIQYSSPGEVSPSQKSSLRLVHDDGVHTCLQPNGTYSRWCDITLGPPFTDPTRNVICGSTGSLSPFALILPASTPPTISGASSMVAEASGPAGAAVSYSVTATDAEDGPLTPTCAPASGAMFAIGETEVDCSVTDSSGVTVTASFTVTVRDTTGPALAGVPAAPVVAYATSTAGATVSYPTPTAADAVDGTRPVTCTPASGTTFPAGQTTVNCMSSDARGNSSLATFTVWAQYQAPSDGTFFLPPVRANGSSIFAIGRPVPVRFRLIGASAGITNLTAKLVVMKVSDAIAGTTTDTSDETVDDTGFSFIYRPVLRWYAYRWRTRDQTQGTYQLRADLGDGVVHQVNVSLKATK
jgi:alpha-tubulin suppressor-like RCC1 family protein